MHLEKSKKLGNQKIGNSEIRKSLILHVPWLVLHVLATPANTLALFSGCIDRRMDEWDCVKFWKRYHNESQNKGAQNAWESGGDIQGIIMKFRLTSMSPPGSQAFCAPFIDGWMGWDGMVGQLFFFGPYLENYLIFFSNWLVYF